MTTDNMAHARQLVASGADLASVNDVCCFVLLLRPRGLNRAREGPAGRSHDCYASCMAFNSQEVNQWSKSQPSSWKELRLDDA